MKTSVKHSIFVTLSGVCFYIHVLNVSHQAQHESSSVNSWPDCTCTDRRRLACWSAARTVWAPSPCSRCCRAPDAASSLCGRSESRTAHCRTAQNTEHTRRPGPDTLLAGRAAGIEELAGLSLLTGILPPLSRYRRPPLSTGRWTRPAPRAVSV